MVEETYTPIINPVTPDFTTKINAAVNGFITNENGEAVEAATITAGTATTTTDEFGYFKINTAAFAKSAGFIQVSKAGYFTGYRTFLPVEAKETFIRLQLIPKTYTGTVDSDAGGTASIAGGATVTLPANAVVIASNNSPYSGTVNIAAHWLDPSDMQTTSLTMPGDLTGVDSAGHLNVLKTFGMLAVELTGNSGELLQIAPGKKASLHFPLPSSLQAAAPSYIPLWYFDETKGVWIQQGNAIKNGSSYNGEVSHFTFWNCDVGFPLVNFNVQVVDAALNPLCNVPVSVTADEDAFLSRVSYTDTNGVVNGLIPANKNLRVDINIVGPCNQAVPAKFISTANNPIDLGTVKVNLNEYSAVLQGNVTKCNGNPVTDGYVIVVGFGNNSVIQIKNGSFSAAGIFCPGTNANFIACDRETSLKSTVQTLPLVTGINNIGSLEACTAPGAENIHIEFTGTTSPITYTLPQYLFGGNFYFANDSTSLNVIDLLNGNQQVLQFSFTGPAAPGTYPLSNNSIILDGQTITYYAPISVTVTNYGLVGQFITGNFGGLANIGENVFINFTVQRDQ